MHTFSNTHIFTLASNNSLPLPFQFPFTFFLFLKKNSARNTREDYSNRASSRPDLDCQTRGKQHSISRTIWRNLRGQREHRIFRFDPARFFDRKHNTENLPSGVGRIYFACENAETFPIAGRGRGGLPTFREVKTNENTRSRQASCTGCSINVQKMRGDDFEQ